jgi:hypothetical protein
MYIFFGGVWDSGRGRIVSVREVHRKYSGGFYRLPTVITFPAS